MIKVCSLLFQPLTPLDGEKMAERMEDVVNSHPGEQAVEKFLEEFVKLPLDKLSPEQGFNKIQQLKRKLKIDENPYVSQLIS